MNSQALFFAQPLLGRRALLVGAGAVALAGTIFLGRVGAPDDSTWAANRMVELHVSRLPVQSLDELKQKSDAVVLGRVVSKSATHFILPDAQQARAFTPAPVASGVPGNKLPEIKGTGELGRSQDNIIAPPAGLPVTDFTVEVSRVLDGKLTPGSKVVVSQVGGEIEIPLGAGAPVLKRTIVAEHDPNMVVGQEQVLFLARSGANYSVAGGPEGRFSLDAKRQLQPVDEGSAVAKAQQGLTVDDLAAKLKSIRQASGLGVAGS